MNGTPARQPFELHDDAPVYVISVAAQLTGLHPQTLRQYDRLGLVSPGRTAGRGRRYSAREIEMLHEVARLSADGVSLVGIKRILELERHVDALQRQIALLQVGRTESAPGGREGASRPTVGREVVPVREQATIVVWSRTANS